MRVVLAAAFLLGVLWLMSSPEEEAVETPAQQESRMTPFERSVLADIEGMTHCNVRLQEAARAAADVVDGLYRWTETELEERFGRMRSDDPNVTTYFGNAIEFRDEDGSWVPAWYECDWDGETAEIVDVRVR